jgi:nitrile hydratase beta subunit
MNGVHDVGGMQGFGPVLPEVDEPPFHEEWERRSFSITIALGALRLWNIDQMRHERESLPPAEYLSSSYYRIWFLALENAIRKLGPLDREGLRAHTAEKILGMLSSRSSYGRPIDSQPVFQPGQRVRARNINPNGHTRLPRYARGHVGTVVAVRGAHVYPDRNAAPLGQEPDRAPEWLYTVDFSARELWGEDADPTVTTSIDAWEPYLEAV